MKTFIANNKNILISLGTNMILVLLAVFVFGTRYATDDDIAMARIAYGIFFEPQNRLVFTCTAFGSMLKALSGFIDGINWQLILYYISLLYGGIVSFYYVLKKEKRFLTVLWLLVVTAFYYSTYIDINFSVITSMLTFFGYVTLFIGAYSKDKKPIILSIVILSFAMIIRYESFFALSLFAFFAFLLIFVKAVKKDGFTLAGKQYILSFAVSLCIPMCLLIVDRVSYKNETWSKYIEYNDNRSQILDFQSVLQYEDQSYFEALGLSEAMVESLDKWQFNDTDVFSEQLISKLADDSRKYNPTLTTDFIFEALGYSVEKICKIYYFALGIIFLAVITIKKSKDKIGNISVFALPWIMIIPLVVEVSFYYFLNRGIDRVFRTTGLGFWCAMMVLLCCDYFEDNDESLFEKKWILYVTMSIMFIGICCQIDKLKDVRGFHLVDTDIVSEKLAFLEDGRIYMCDIDSVLAVEDAYGVWQVPPKGSMRNCIELGGWMVNYPTVKDKQEQLGVINPYKSLISNNNVYLLTTEDGKTQLEFLRSAYDKNIESELIEKHGDLSVYKYIER